LQLNRPFTLFSSLTIHLDRATKARLERLAATTVRSKVFLVSVAIREYLNRNEGPIGEIQRALKEAEQGLFAREEDVTNLKAKWLDTAR
jgi:predicted transcriptional regulator